jgi:hypothetical protein
MVGQESQERERIGVTISGTAPPCGRKGESRIRETTVARAIEF